tara:strand:- start:1111 stop:1710 length:600 start_codon:yes stop_codon:yes gene_type:complete
MYIYKIKEKILYIDIILFAVIAAVLATNLYRVLGKRTVSEKKAFKNKAMENKIKDSIFSEQVMEYSQRQILDLDKNFSFYNFIQGSKEAFKIIVEAFKNKKVEKIKHLVSKEVYDNFQRAIDLKSSDYETFNISTVEASILNIEVVKNYANIKVKFLSNQRVTLNNQTKNLDNIKDVWTFEKDMKTNSLVWKLVEVGTD